MKEVLERLSLPVLFYFIQVLLFPSSMNSEKIAFNIHKIVLYFIINS